MPDSEVLPVTAQAVQSLPGLQASFQVRHGASGSMDAGLDAPQVEGVMRELSPGVLKLVGVQSSESSKGGRTSQRSA